MLKQWNARLLAISAALALSACATQQSPAPVDTGSLSSTVTGAYDQVTGAVSTGVNNTVNAVTGAINSATNPYGTTYTPSAQSTYTPSTSGQYGRVGGQYVPNYSPVDTTAATHIVQAGDTVYNIAKRYGISQDTLRSLNGLSGNTISIGQTLRVKSGGGNTVGNATSLTSTPTASVLNTTQLNTSATANSTTTAATSTAATAATTAAATTAATTTTAATAAATNAASTSSTSSASTAATTTAATSTTSSSKNTSSTISDSFLPTQNVANIVWQAPTAGKIARAFGGDNKGVDISGTRGQNVVAAADGQVVYSGSGLRGYGNLVIIQHTPSYLTAYGHNDSLVVREGESVKRGQIIAKMGQTDSSNGVKLHFEVRENGTPVDPTRFVKF